MSMLYPPRRTGGQFTSDSGLTSVVHLHGILAVAKTNSSKVNFMGKVICDQSEKEN
jgi:hypothetical protein